MGVDCKTATVVDRASLVPISVDALKAARAEGLDLYKLDEDGGTGSFFRGKDYPLENDDFQRLQAKGIKNLYLEKAAFESFRKQTRERLDEILADEEFGTTERFQVLQFAIESEITSTFQRIDVDDAVGKSVELGGHLTKLIQLDHIVPEQLYGVMRHDFQTFSHVINVSSYCVLLAQALGVRDPETLEAMAISGLLHDIGKRFIPAKILSKPGRLTDDEFAVIKEHPRAGYMDLCEREEFSEAQLMMVYQHHERIDGGGYPVGIDGDDMHAWAKLCAVADVFDAITGDRPYRSPMTKREGLEHLSRIAGTHLDKEMVKCWTALMAKQ